MTRPQDKKRNVELILVGVILLLPSMFSNAGVIPHSDTTATVLSILNIVGVVAIIVGVLTKRKATK